MVTTSVEIVVVSILLFTGSALLCAALYGIIFHYGATQLFAALMIWRAILIVLAITAAWDVGRKLKPKQLIVIAMADLFGAFIVIFLILPSSPDSIFAWLAISALNNILLDIALTAGYMKKHSVKVETESAASNPATK